MRIEIIAKMPHAFVHECKKCNFTRLTGTKDFRQTQFDSFPQDVKRNMERTLKILSMLEQDFPRGSIEVHVTNPLNLRVGWRLRKMKEKDPIVLVDELVAFRGEVPEYMDLKTYLQSIPTTSL